ncbi:2,3-bisphosphoglycerate-independent phosphoglycerate mutase [Desertifilum sp. FACHB-1129]|uniref:2,3-bisphosphoglycerate-independent phosphoglycerate mutase n=1 Tax=Desertifilum tharense IPPAS B-1220 TaxID=1781255 RepID=A0A1E5QLU5_9CYAN|nr:MULTISPECIES: 2,3-bisphosphoglycerate-independent phosphoglycerate mutase [Desertifilum]MDA0208770.1 2,3-bisphosphoglycerate-independent phosphoglycerate mutase [Cyanobacteria bacterium FC1]MBD2310972.1 2,3-bisphosphoglycerate-independent phosphoglycerate mutase [Desertifilum sp. FACHB-1129]MBD2321377.1 2,3-bisphosphoglycerate-independent phosphoglycerate mutase [Desertifilum sp. FACHB-866]MBD2331316.1 2,3-bisphosphoglycerate-independent phosphoglycerate mutase [Desertifilum sp. FACHB-868]O
MAQAPVSPVVLVILDGWGYREATDGNAIAAAKTPVMNSLWAAYPKTLISTSGKAVGLPEGQMGNSEVGHMNLGAGRVVKQELMRITDAFEEGSIQENLALLKVCQEVRASGGKLHLVGLCSDGGVHSHLSHLLGLLEFAKQQDIAQVCIHAITDGRDTYPTDGIGSLKKIEEAIAKIGIGQIVTISGRYYAMDRDRRWDRVRQAYEVMTQTGSGDGRTPTEVMEASYAEGVTDEFVVPVRIAQGAIEPNDGVIFFNFRPDRARQLTQAFVDPGFADFERSQIQPLSFVTFTQYDSTLPVLVAFEPQNLSNILGEVLAQRGLRQFRTAETEKYAHVTYFFNGGLEEPFEGEDRHLIPSPMVATYDKAPEMSAAEVTEVAIAAISEQVYSLVVINYANPDMVGHTGNLQATVTAIETVDECLGRLIESILKAGGTALILADHGNAELMNDAEGNPWTAHTTNPVPFILVEGEGLKIPGHGASVNLKSDGRLADIAPTILEILKLPQPPEMTGRSLIGSPAYEVRQNRSPVRLSR